jgi:hypothetical protein
VRQLQTLTRMTRRPRQGATGKESLTRGIDRCYYIVGLATVILFACAWAKIQEPQYPLIDDRLCQNLRSRQAADFGYERRRMKAASFDQFGDAVPPKLAQRSVGWEAARPARPFRIPVDLIARFEIMCRGMKRDARSSLYEHGCQPRRRIRNRMAHSATYGRRLPRNPPC